MDAKNKSDNGKRRVFIPSFLRRSGIKLTADVCAEPSEQGAPVQVPDRSSNPGSEPATPDLQPHSHKPQRHFAWRPRSFLNEIATTPLTRTRHCDSPADTMGSGEAKKAETESDYFTSATRPSSESDKSTRMKGDESEVPSAADDGASTTAIRGEEEASKGTGSSSGAGTLTPPSSVAEQIDGVDEDSETSSKAPSATVQLSSAMAAYEVAREYQRRVDRGEVRAPTDQDRANYVNWKRNYIAWLAKKRGEEAREQVSRRER
ncbi:hypothetical protein BFW01_g4626 [Lasiodiplodia theobromae]|nr:hypothetical protein BFW01_g4626 [Lasiodiplodia theobromae]